MKFVVSRLRKNAQPTEAMPAITIPSGAIPISWTLETYLLPVSVTRSLTDRTSCRLPLLARMDEMMLSSLAILVGLRSDGRASRVVVVALRCTGRHGSCSSLVRALGRRRRVLRGLPVRYELVQRRSPLLALATG